MKSFSPLKLREALIPPQTTIQLWLPGHSPVILLVGSASLLADSAPLTNNTGGEFRAPNC